MMTYENVFCNISIIKKFNVVDIYYKIQTF